jgi:hypothetical protein
LDPGNVTIPLSWSDAPGQTAYVNNTDLVPAVELGNFSASQVKNFTLYASAPVEFSPQVAGYFVAPVPEPSTFVMLVGGGVALLGYTWRRRRIA